jgi:hypothetical protein
VISTLSPAATPFGLVPHVTAGLFGRHVLKMDSILVPETPSNSNR